MAKAAAKTRKKAEEKSIYRQALKRVTDRLDGTGLPWPKRPGDYGTEYEFPSDITVKSPASVGKLQSRLAGWEGYVIRLLALADIDLDLLQISYDIALGEKMAEIQKSGSKCTLKDTLRAEALTAVPALKRATFAIAERKALVSALKAQKSIYEKQRNAVSREQSRRSDEFRGRHND